MKFKKLLDKVVDNAEAELAKENNSGGGYNIFGDSSPSPGPTGIPSINISQADPITSNNSGLAAAGAGAGAGATARKKGSNDDGLTAGQRMAQARRRYSIINLVNAKQRLSKMNGPMKGNSPTFAPEKQYLLKVNKTTKEGTPVEIYMEDATIRKDK